MQILDRQVLAEMALTCDPFDFAVARDVIRPEARADLNRGFPAISFQGLLPAGSVRGGPAFEALIGELESPETAAAFSRLFGIDLMNRPMMITVRAQCDARDGRIHTDSETKLVTALLYLNDSWDVSGGRLRLLRGPDDLADMVAEVPPTFGTLVTFRRSKRSFHGHAPFVGPRRCVMFNWMASGFAAQREILRHRLSARVKRAFAATADV